MDLGGQHGPRGTDGLDARPGILEAHRLGNDRNRRRGAGPGRGKPLEKDADAGDTVLEIADFKVFVDAQSAPLLQGVALDFIDGLEGSGFKFENPNATNSCGCGSSFSCG